MHVVPSGRHTQRTEMEKRMIIWISGPYGVGKSTLAEAMAERLGSALVFDAEAVGNAVRENYPELPYGVIFEDYPLWSRFCCTLLKDIHENFRRDILVPMTLVRKGSYRMIRSLRRAGIDTKLVILEASAQTVRERILARGEEDGCWCMENIELSRAGSSALPGLHVPTDGRTVDELCEFLLARLRRRETAEGGV